MSPISYKQKYSNNTREFLWTITVVHLIYDIVKARHQFGENFIVAYGYIITYPHIIFLRVLIRIKWGCVTVETINYITARKTLFSKYVFCNF